ncbi:MAG: helix-turn-helix domain-containing protein [Negativibacillus sp.]|nr:helix-turn-helix domain-containing protein [Negativibacillus sp.]
MPKGVPNKRYTPEFKKLVIETMQEEKLSYSETCRRFEVNSRDRIKSWEQIYLTEGPEGLAIERRGRGSKGVRQSSCRSRQKKICWQKSSGCVRRTIT